MGSCCCKNVRVTGVPQQEPVHINNIDDVNTKPISSVFPPIPKEFDSDQNNTQTIPTDIPQHPNPDQEDKTSDSFRQQHQVKTNENDPSKDRKAVLPSQLPPIRRPKSTNQNEKRHSVSSIQSFSKKTPNEKPNNQIINVRLPPLQKTLTFETDDNLVESILDDTHSDHYNPMNSDWNVGTIADGSEFYDDYRFFTSTPIPVSSDDSDSAGEYAETLNYLLQPVSHNVGSTHRHIPVPLSTLQILRLREQTAFEETTQSFPIPDLKLSSQNFYGLNDNLNLPMIRIRDNDDSDTPSNLFDESTIYLSNPPVIIGEKNLNTNKIDLLHNEAFDETFFVQRQLVIENTSYRLIIEAWRPNSIEELVDHIKKVSQNKPILDCLWIIFYWITRNIEYDTVPYVGKKHVDKSAEVVFRTRKAIADGYANLFQRLCDDLDLIAEKIYGYSKLYVFDISNKSSAPIDHTWNAVQINQHWYLIDLTWSVGHFNDEQIFKRQFNFYYFLPRPNEMIYHHFPALERWQLLKQTITMAQYMQMPKLWPQFFQYDLHLISPSDTIHVDLDPNQSYAIVLIKVPRDINLIATFTLNEKEIDGGHQILFDLRKQLCYCYFAPNSTGVHIIRLFAKLDNNQQDSYKIVTELNLDVRQIPSKIITFPKTWRPFYELNLEIVSPHDTHLIKMDHGDTHTEILVRAPIDVEITGRLTVDNTVKIPGGHCTYFDRRKGLWRCLFAPNRNGLFEAFILAKRRLDPTTFAIVARFRIKAKRISIPPLSYPKTWQLFHDLDLQVEVPRNSSTVLWTEFASYAQVCIKTPDDVTLMSCIERNGFRIENGSLTQFNNEKQHWQLLFAPERTGEHKLLVFAHCSTPDGVISGIAVEFYLNVTQLRHSMKFPVIYTTFFTRKCRIFEPLNRILKRNAVVSIHCEIPNARQVDLTIDSKWIKTEGYQNSILKRQITVGTKDVIIYAKYDENTIYNELIKYTVQ